MPFFNVCAFCFLHVCVSLSVEIQFVAHVVSGISFIVMCCSLCCLFRIRYILFPLIVILFFLLLYGVIYALQDTAIFDAILKNQGWMPNTSDADEFSNLKFQLEVEGPRIMIVDVQRFFPDEPATKYDWGMNGCEDQLCSLNLCLYRCLAHGLIISLPLLV